MILSKTPFRASLVGGGSDLPSYYTKRGGAVVSMAINKYMYITLHKKFDRGYRLSYSITENCDNLSDLEHDIARELIKNSGIMDDLEITSIADVPSGTGLGSSSAYAVGLEHALSAYKGEFRSKFDLAETACDIEINILNKPIGKQDQYAASFGGINLIEFGKYGDVTVSPIALKQETLREMSGRFLMFYTGERRSADDILSDQVSNLELDERHLDSTSLLVDMAYELCNQLQDNNIDNIGSILHQGWEIKQRLSDNITNDYINSLYNIAIDAGAEGGKLLGAGGSGFILLYAHKKNHTSIRNALSSLRELNFDIDMHGSSIIFCND